MNCHCCHYPDFSNLYFTFIIFENIWSTSNRLRDVDHNRLHTTSVNPHCKMTHLRTWVLRPRPPDELLRVFMFKLSFGTLLKINLPFSLQPRKWVTESNQPRKLTMQVTSSHSLRRKDQVSISNMYILRTQTSCKVCIYSNPYV
jgi:hypothetical protein